MQIDFLAVGELLADLITTDYCEGLQNADTFHIFPGGSPANVAANLKFLRKEAAMVSCVGDDGIGKMLLQSVKTTGLLSSLIQISPAHPTSIVLVSRSKGTPDFIAYRGADAQLGIIEQSLIDATRIIHTTSFALSKNPAQSNIIKALQTAHALGKTVSLDWNFAPSIWADGDGREVFNTIMQLQPLLKISIDDMERFFGKALSIEECRHALNSYRFSTVCLTCGREGVWYKIEDGSWSHKPALMVKKLVDTTGAGDAFWAGFIAAYLEEHGIERCITNALEMAAKKIQQEGPLYAS
jgi:fructokinase